MKIGDKVEFYLFSEKRVGEIYNINKKEKTVSITFEGFNYPDVQTFKKLQVMSALDAQTGPAVRNDKKTISKHIQLLNESDFLHLYKEITKNIKSNELQGKIKKH